jgi:hypothetical protein
MSSPAPVQVAVCPPGLPDLAPMIRRQRLVIEGVCQAPMTDEHILHNVAESSG